MNVCILGSSGGFAFDYLLLAIKLGVVSAQVNRIITDRPCRTNEVAKKHNINSTIIKQDMSIDRGTYSDLLLEQIPENIDIILISLRRLISGKILSKYKNKIVNTHPSLLPSYKGYGANNKLLNEGKTVFGGCSCHIVNDLPDDGPIIIQSVVPLGVEENLTEWELKLWHHQKYNLSQTVQFFSDNRIKVTKEKVIISDAKYGGLPTNPSIEIDFSEVDKFFKIEK